MRVISIGSLFPEVYEKRHEYPTDEDLFQALAEAIKAAKGSKLVEVKTYKEGWTAEDFMEERQAVKSNLLALEGNLTITLTKKGRGIDTNMVQLRGWVRNPCFWEHGGHVDEYDNGAIFEACGPFELMKSLTQKFLAQGRRCFEDQHYVVWL
ncbi:MAG: hypothetical protein V4473_02395 [Patescibacteria group bacterium]